MGAGCSSSASAKPIISAGSIATDDGGGTRASLPVISAADLAFTTGTGGGGIAVGTAGSRDSLPRLKSLAARASDLMSLASSISSHSPNPSSSTSRRKLSRVSHFSLDRPATLPDDTTSYSHVRDVMTHVLGQRKDQDRAVCVPQLLPGVLFAGVFDGHGRNGEIRSELATTQLPRLLREHLLQQPTADDDEARFSHAIDACYGKFHEELDQLYEDTVFRQAVDNARKHYGEEANENNVRMPQDGGTTATSVLVSSKVLVLGWVGDSRAVVCRRQFPSKTGAGASTSSRILARFSSRLRIEPLTEDHNVSTNIAEEMTRVENQGGEIHGSHIAAYQAEGMLQLTRSLGDSPFHRTGLVLAKPGVVCIPLGTGEGGEQEADEGALLFLLVASDGLWDRFSNKEAMQFVYKRLKRDRYYDSALSEQQRGDMLADCARALENEALKRAAERKAQSDDITVLIITFTRGWTLEAQEDASSGPSF